MRIAIISDWLTVYSGAERVLEQMLLIFKEADLYSLCDFIPLNKRQFLLNKETKTSFIQHLPFAKKKYRSYLPLMPLAIEQFDLSFYDLVISSSHAVAKGIITSPNQLHLCMCYSPMRYAWDLQHQYLKESNLEKGILSWFARYILHKMRIWDIRSSYSVDKFIAISHFIKQRIEKCYRRESTVIYPPVGVHNFEICEEKENYYLTASRMVPYKKVDLIVEAFSKMPEKKLVVIGDGPDFNKIKSKATLNVEILGFQPTEVLKKYMQKAKAFVFAAEEDFGIAPLEAQACGTPVIAYGRGGARETIVDLNSDSPTGVCFKEQTVDSIINAVNNFEENGHVITPQNCRKNSLRFSPERFQTEFKKFVLESYDEFKSKKENFNNGN